MNIMVDMDMDVLQSDVDFYNTLTSVRGIKSIEDYKKMLFKNLVGNSGSKDGTSEGTQSVKENTICNTDVDVQNHVTPSSSVNMHDYISENSSLDRGNSDLDMIKNDVSYLNTGVVLDDFCSNIGTGSERGINDLDNDLYVILENPFDSGEEIERILHGVVLEDYVSSVNSLKSTENSFKSCPETCLHGIILEDFISQGSNSFGEIHGVSHEGVYENSIPSEEVPPIGTNIFNDIIAVEKGIILEDFISSSGDYAKESVADDTIAIEKVEHGIILEDVVFDSAPVVNESMATNEGINTVKHGVILEDVVFDSSVVNESMATDSPVVNEPKVTNEGSNTVEHGIIFEDFISNSSVVNSPDTSETMSFDDEDIDELGIIFDYMDDDTDESDITQDCLDSGSSTVEGDSVSTIDGTDTLSGDELSDLCNEDTKGCISDDEDDLENTESNSSTKVIDFSSRTGISNPTSDKLVKVVNSEGESELKKIPHDIREFLKLYPNSEISEVLKYYPKKELVKQLKLGRIFKVRNKLSI